MKWITRSLAFVICLVTATPSMGGGTVLVPVQDNTLYEILVGVDEGNGAPPSNGAGDYFFAGRTAFTNELRRGLLMFDIAGSLPPGAVVTNATLSLEVSRTISGPGSVELHRLLSDWGEGASDADGEEGTGTPAATGDATWIHTFYDTGFWASAGGDFSATVSAFQSVDGTGPYAWGSTPEMVADVQSWLDNPSGNYGWLVLGDEVNQPSAKRFNSRESGTSVPQLAITFQAPVPSTPIWGLSALLVGLLVMGFWWLRTRVESRSVAR